jgi:hypothetical protein
VDFSVKQLLKEVACVGVSSESLSTKHERQSPIFSESVRVLGLHNQDLFHTTGMNE